MLFTVVFNPVKNVSTESFLETKTPKDKFLPLQNVFALFLNKLQEANYFLEQRMGLSSVIEELPNKQHFFETSEVDKVKLLNNPYPWFLRLSTQLNAFPYTFFSNSLF